MRYVWGRKRKCFGRCGLSGSPDKPDHNQCTRAYGMLVVQLVTIGITLFYYF